MRVELTGGAYSAKSIIANAQRCVNLYPEKNPGESEPAASVTHYPTPGLVSLSSPPTAGEGRCIYVSKTGIRFDVVGSTVYTVDTDNTYSAIGTLSTSSGPVSIADNGISAFIVDGTNVGFTVDLSTMVMSIVTDTSFYGADSVDFVDTYFVLNKPASPQFYISLSNDITFDALDIASKSTYADNLVVARVMHREIWLIGELTTEVWYNSGASDFTFERMPGIFIEHGCAAKASVAKIDLGLYWLAKDLQGQSFVARGAAYQAKRISTHAIESEIATYSVISDAIGYSYMQEGHPFYVLTFPTANKTWVFDVTTDQWHERMWLDSDGQENRHRSNCHAAWNGMNVVLDWETGEAYSMDPNVYDDAGAAMLHIRSFPHIGAQGKRAMFRQFVADMEVGRSVVDSDLDAQVRLRWSDDRGASWGNKVSSSLGKTGAYLTNIQFQRLGYARDRVFELSWSAPVRTALNGAFVDLIPART